MNSGAFKRALGLILIYIGVFVAIVFVQFSRSPGFLAKSGHLAVSASFAAKDRKGQPSSVKISYAGLIIELSPGRPAWFKAADGNLAKAVPKSVEKIQGGARIVFDIGGELRAVASTDSGRPSFSLGASAPGGGADALVLAYDLSGSARLIDKARKLVLDSSGGPYEFSFPSGSVDVAAGTMALAFGDRPSVTGLSLVQVAPVPVAASKPPTARPGQAKPTLPASMDQAAYKAALDAWTAKAWQGFAASRWDPDRGGWKDAAGSTSFSELTLVAYLAEAAARSVYPEALAKVRPLISRSSSSLSYLSVPYLGNTVDRMEAFIASDAQEARRLSALAAAKDQAFFEKEGLVHFLADRMAKTQAQDAYRFVLETDPSKLGVSAARGYLAAALEASGLLSESENPFTGAEAAANRLISALAKTQDGWFLRTGEANACDLRLSLAAGLSLTAYGSASGKDAILGAGQALVTTALSLSDSQGILPSTYVLPSGSGQGERSGSILPEDIYALAVSNPSYPHELSFYKDLGPGVWAWTISPSVSVNANSASASFLARFPVGQAHYMAIFGLKPFSNIKLYGINYSPDAAFESYDVSGYLYRKASNALYLKMKHKQELEKIELSF
jgi:hypothetical protein